MLPLGRRRIQLSDVEVFRKIKLLHDYKSGKVLSVREINYKGDQNYLDEYFGLELEQKKANEKKEQRDKLANLANPHKLWFQFNAEKQEFDFSTGSLFSGVDSTLGGLRKLSISLSNKPH